MAASLFAPIADGGAWPACCRDSCSEMGRAIPISGNLEWPLRADTRQHSEAMGLSKGNLGHRSCVSKKDGH